VVKRLLPGVRLFAPLVPSLLGKLDSMDVEVRTKAREAIAGLQPPVNVTYMVGRWVDAV